MAHNTIDIRIALPRDPAESQLYRKGKGNGLLVRSTVDQVMGMDGFVPAVCEVVEKLLQHSKAIVVCLVIY
jgi:hypothetical protein